VTAASSPGPFAPGQSPFRVKGVTYRNFWDFVAERVPGGRAAVLEQLRDPALRAFAEQTFLPSSFYDTLPTVLMCQAAATVARLPSNEFVRELSRYSVERDTKGVYRFLLRLASPGMIMERTPAAARQYFNFVQASVEKVGPKSYRTRAHGIPEFLAQFYMTVTEAFLRHALTLAGARNVQNQWGRPEPDGDREGVPLVVVQRQMSWD
jgi:uncharacterized protein (TIGR02265 family)